MKLIIAIVSNEDSHTLQSSLTKANYSVTKLSTTGGFLKLGNTTFLIGTDEDRVDACIDIIKKESQTRTEIVPSTASYDLGRYASFPLEVSVGGATIFVVDIEKFVKV